MAYRTAVRKRNLVVLITLLVSGLALFLYWWQTHARSEQEAIRRVLAAMEQAAERRQPYAFMRHISDRYLDEDGNNKRMVGQLVFGASRTREPFEVVVNSPQIDVTGKSAMVKTTVEVIAGSRQEYRVPIVIRFEKELLGGWMVVWSEGWQGTTG